MQSMLPCVSRGCVLVVLVLGPCEVSGAFATHRAVMYVCFLIYFVDGAAAEEYVVASAE